MALVPRDGISDWMSKTCGFRWTVLGSALVVYASAMAQNYNSQIDQAVGDLTKVFRSGGLKAAQGLSTECWRRLSRFPDDVDRAVQCSTYVLATSFIDNQISAAKGEDAQISIGEANAQARTALSAAGVKARQLPLLLGDIRQEAAQALNRSKVQ